MNLEKALEALQEAVDHAETLGLESEVDRGRAVLGEVEARLGFTGAIYSLALVGGTGVGKSSLLNAMAGTDVSSATVLRPTTQQAVAWVGREDIPDVEPLLEWLEVSRVVEHDVGLFSGVAVVDMPDFDSIATKHRETVDRLLPRLDSVLWVVDPQKYDDERLYEYLRPGPDRIARVEIVLNKVDQLTGAQRRQVADDIRRRTDAAGLGLNGIHLVSASTGHGVDALVQEIASRAAAKQLIAAKLRDDITGGISAIAEAAGVTGALDIRSDREIVAQKARVTEAALEAVDPGGLSRQVAAAHLSRAGFVAGSVLSRLFGIFRALTGTRRRSADPVRFLKTWRSRGDLSRAANVLRNLYFEATTNASPELRAAILGEIDQNVVKQSLATAVDAAVTEVARDIEVRTPWTWRILAIAQFIALAGVVVALLWFLTLWIGPASLLVGTVDIPVLGPVPSPLALLVVSLLMSLVVGGLVRLDATWRGKRAARRVDQTVRRMVDREIDQHGFSRLAEIDGARVALAGVYQTAKSGT